jgi:GntR family transcriptional regulator of vanillate catabolism
MKQSESATHGRRAVIQIREKIISGAFPGGTRLFEVPLAEALDISRTPVREAMSRLAAEGLLDRLPNGGFVVRVFTYEDVIDSIELRGVMEGTAARIAAERGAGAAALKQIKATLQALDACFGDAADDVDFELYSDLNEKFHHQLARLAGSEIVGREVERASALPFASPSAFLPDRANIKTFRRSLRTAQEQHRLLIEAIEAREGSRAEAIAREHARTARRNLDYILAQDPALIGQIPGLSLMRS